MGADVATGARSHLERAQLDHLHDLLIEQRRALAERLSSGFGLDGDAEDSVTNAVVARTEQALADVDDALARLAVGTYGRCTSCGDAIPFERLEALPETARCVRCQARGVSLLR
jgi:RNA polymerase-binding transcription factor DksA